MELKAYGRIAHNRWKRWSDAGVRKPRLFGGDLSSQGIEWMLQRRDQVDKYYVV